MEQLEIGGEFSFEFYYINEAGTEVQSVSGMLSLGEYPSVEAIQRVKADCDAQVAEKNDGFVPVTPGQMASIAVRKATGETVIVGGMGEEWAEPLSGGYLGELVESEESAEISESVFEDTE